MKEVAISVELARRSDVARVVSPAAEQPSAFGHFLATNHPRAPDYVVCGANGDVVAAKWHRPAARCAVEIALAQHTLMYHVGGSTSVAKFVDGRCVGTAAQHGSVTFSPRDEHSEWVRGGVCEVMHVYIAPSLIQRYADENLTCPVPPEIDPIFAVHDPWLESYFQLLQAEFGLFGRDTSRPEALLLTQSMELLLRHLVCWHSNVPKSVRQREASSVRPCHWRHDTWPASSPTSMRMSAATLRSAISLSLSAFPSTISFAAFARPPSEHRTHFW